MGSVGPCRLLRISFLPQIESADVEGCLDPSSRPQNALTLLVARRRDALDQLQRSIRHLIRMSLVFLLGMIVFLVHLALVRGLWPLDDLRRQVENIQPENLEARIIVLPPVQELAPMVTQLNLLLMRLENTVLKERLFTRDVAHELQSPLAELRELCDVGLLDPGDCQMIREFFADVRDITMNMESLVKNLLDLSR